MENAYKPWNPYGNILGFLYWFSCPFRDALIKADIKTFNMMTGEIETVQDSVWLPSFTEIGLNGFYKEGESFPLFEDCCARYANPTLEYGSWCDQETEISYFLRSPHENSTHNVYAIVEDGVVSQYHAYIAGGIRPSVLLKSETPVSEEPDGYGIYYVG